MNKLLGFLIGAAVGVGFTYIDALRDCYEDLNERLLNVEDTEELDDLKNITVGTLASFMERFDDQAKDIDYLSQKVREQEQALGILESTGRDNILDLYKKCREQNESIINVTANMNYRFEDLRKLLGGQNGNQEKA